MVILTEEAHWPGRKNETVTCHRLFSEGRSAETRQSVTAILLVTRVESLGLSPNGGELLRKMHGYQSLPRPCILKLP
jgi:hypothetical protein